MRLFIAIDPPPDIREKLRPLQEKLQATKADVRWVAPENLHITVKFLGEVAETLLPEILARLTAAAAQVPAFPLELEGLSRFPDKGPARVIISRVLSPDQRITKLHRLIDSALGGIGLPLDTRALTPHLTLGRVASNHGLNKLLRLLDKHDLDFFGSFTADRAILYQSLLGAGTGGIPRHLALGSAPCADSTHTVSEGPAAPTP
jgi:RNA 2',3'-cyclic 3'-phosphodiesterase